MNDEAMKMLTKMVIETFTRELAGKARMFASTLPSEVSAADALEAFASSIESTNDKLNPSSGRS